MIEKGGTVTTIRKRGGVRVTGESVERLRAMAKNALEDAVTTCIDIGIPEDEIRGLMDDTVKGLRRDG